MSPTPPAEPATKSVGLVRFVAEEIGILFSSSARIRSRMIVQRATPYRGLDVRGLEDGEMSGVVRTRRILAGIYVSFIVVLPLLVAARSVTVVWDAHTASDPVAIVVLVGMSLFFAAIVAVVGLFVSARVATWYLVRVLPKRPE